MKGYKKQGLPIGFKAAGISAGIKNSGRLDLSLVFSESPCKAAALFTTNKIKAAHIKVCRRYLKRSKSFNAVIINSGNANCFTGNKGTGNAEEITGLLARELDVRRQGVLIASTGIIGRSLRVDKIKKAIPVLIKSLNQDGLIKAAKAIMTTDTFYKIATRRLNIAGKDVFICGFAKGAGMISPNLATMLCIILTDASISRMALRQSLKSAVNKTFNCITVDGCMSTNDSIFLLANGCADNPLINIGGQYFNKFAKALDLLCLDLAKMIVEDAEGATKFIRIRVRQAKTFEEAKGVALKIANSNLFKTAIYGQDPNLGRVVAAVGSYGIDIKEADLKVGLSPLNRRKVDVVVDLNRGESQAIVYTSDLTPEYIKINASYS